MKKEFWNERFSSSEYVYGIHPQIRFKEFFDKYNLKEKSILLLGEGEGRNALYLASKGADIHIIDYSLEGKNKTLKLFENSNYKLPHYQVMDLNDWNPEKKFDFVTSVFCHPRPSQRKGIHQKYVQSLKPEGELFCIGYNKKQIENNSGGPQKLEVLWSTEELVDDFSPHEINLNYFEDNLSEGIYHKGKSNYLSVYFKQGKSL